MSNFDTFELSPKTSLAAPPPSSYLGTVVCVLLGMQILLSVVAIVASGQERSVLQKLENAAYTTEEEGQQAADDSDRITGAIGVFDLLVGLASGILFLVWIYRFCRAAHARSEIPLSVSPGWTVGYFFIPIANLFMPYRGIQQAYRACADPEYWGDTKSSSLILLWWISHLVSSFLGRLLFKWSLRVSSNEESTILDYLNLNLFVMVSESADMLTCILCLAMVMTLRRVIR